MTNKNIIFSTLRVLVLLIVVGMGVFASKLHSNSLAYLTAWVRTISTTMETGNWIIPSPTPEPSPSIEPEPSPSVEPTPSPSPTPAITGLTIRRPNGEDLGCGSIITKNRSIEVDWADSTDPLVTRYWIQQTTGDAMFSPNPVLVPLAGQNLESAYRDNVPNVDGSYTFKVSGGDIQGPSGSWSEECTITLDLTPPDSAITISSSPTRDIEERITNGGFEEGLAAWTTSGSVSVVEGSDNGVTAFQNKMAKIQNSEVAILSQDVTNTSSGYGMRSISFAYNFAAYEDSLQSDQPGLMVFAGENLVYQVWADELTFDGDATTLDASGWQTLTIDLTYVEDPTLTLAFYGGANPAKPAYVYVDEVSTNVAVVNSTAKFSLTSLSNDPGDQVFYALVRNGIREVLSGASPLEFSLSGPTDNNQVEYWAVDALGNEEAHKQFVVYFDDAPPASVIDLQVEDLGTGSGSLTWTAPSDANPFGINAASSYQIRYSPEPIATDISKEDWLALPSLPSQPPLRAGNIEILPIHVDGLITDYHFAIRAKDRAGNLSALSEGSLVKLAAAEPVVEAEATAAATTTATVSAELSVTLEYDPTANTVQFSLPERQSYTEYDYVITYFHSVEGEPIQEAIVGKGTFEATATGFNSNPLYLGTCSGEGLVCVPHLEVIELKLTLTLTGDTMPEKVLEKTL